MRKKARKKSKFSFVSLVICFVSILGSCFFLKNIFSEVSNTFALREELDITNSERENLEEEKAELVDQKEKLQDENYAESVARGDYLFTKSDEQVFILPALDEE